MCCNNVITENAAKRSNKEGIGELLTALKRKGARGLDALVEALEEEEGANQEILEAIRAGELNMTIKTSGALYTVTVVLCTHKLVKAHVHV